MKSFIIILLCCIVAIIAEDSKEYVSKSEIRAIHNKIVQLRQEIAEAKNEERIVVNINEYLDNMMQLIQNWIIKNGLDPLQVPDVENSLGIWPFRLKLVLDGGWMQGLSSVQRGGDATVDYDDLTLNIRLPLAFPVINVNYDYTIIYGVVPQRGGIEGKIKNLRLLVDITINTDTLHITLEEFEITDAGKISLHFSGNPLIDWMSNLVSSFATTLLHGIVINIIEGTLRDVLVQSIDQINQAIRPTDLIYMH